jgi:hypothetical protein
MKTAFYQGRTFDFPDDMPDEEIAKALPGVWEQVKPTLGRAIAAAPETAVREFIQKPALNVKRLGKDILGMDTTEDSQAVAEVDKRLGELSQDLSLPQQAVLYGTSSALGSLPASAIGVGRSLSLLRAGRPVTEAAKKGLGTATTIGAAPTGLNTYGESRDAGLSVGRSLAHATVDALIEKYTEYLPGSKMLENLNRPFWREMGKFMGREITGEEIATVTQDLNAMLGARPEMTLGDIAKDMVLTAGATVIAGGVQGSIMRGAGALLPSGVAPSAAAASTPGAPAPATTLPPAPAAGPAPAPSPAEAISGLTRPAAATVAPANTPMPTPAADAVAQQEAALNASQQGPMVKLYAAIPEGLTTGEVMALPEDEAGANQLLAQSGGKGSVLVAEMPQTQLDQLKAAQVQNPEIQKQLFFGHEVAVPVSMFLGLPASTPTAGATPVSSPAVATAGTSPAAGVAAPSSPAVTPPPSAPPAAPAVAPGPAVEKKATPSRRLSMKIGKAAPKTIVFDTDLGKRHFSLMTKIRKTMSPKTLDSARGKIQAQLDQEMTAFMATVGESDQIMALRVLGEWYNGIVQVTKATPAEVEVRVSQLTPAAYQRKREEILGNRAPEQKVPVTFDEKFAGDAHVERMAKLLTKWIAIFAPSMKIRIIGEGELTGSRARVNRDLDLFKLYVPNRAAGTLSQLAILAHEFGHMLMMWAVANPAYAEQVTKLKENHQVAMREAETMPAVDWFKKYATADQLREAKSYLKTYGLPPEATAREYMNAVDAAHAEHFRARVGQARYELMLERLGGSYARNFDEFAADQVSRYLTKNGARMVPEDLKGFFDSIIATMKTFYERVVKRLEIAPSFEAWLKGLENGDYLRRIALDEQIQSGEYQDSFLNVGREFQFTTKVLNRLPAKPRLKKETIEAEVRRADVTKNEREHILRVMNEMPGPAVDSQEFKLNVLKDLIPLSIEETPKFANYGMHGTYGLQHVFREDNAWTLIYEWPYETPEFVNVHFKKESPFYFAHIREWLPVDSADQAVYVVELQSDWTLDKDQRIQLEDMRDSAAQAERELALFTPETERAIAKLNELDAVVEDPKAYVRALTFRAEGGFFQPRGLPDDLLDPFVEISTEVETAIREDNSASSAIWAIVNALESENPLMVQAAYAVHEQIGEGEIDDNFLPGERESIIKTIKDFDRMAELSHLMPKNWWHLVVRDYINRVASTRIDLEVKPTKVRFPLGFTAAVIGNQTLARMQNGQLLVPMPQKFKGWREGKSSVTIPGVWEYMSPAQKLKTMETAYREVSKDSTYRIPIGPENLTPDGNALLVEPSWKTLWNFYDKELAAFLKREYGATQVTDPTGLSWMEVNLPDFQGLTPEYFSFKAGVDDMVDAIAPALPPATKMQETFRGFLLNSLQINQLAKIFPNVPGLQRFRKAMQDMFSMKNRLLAAPNERMVEWYGLGRAVGRRMEKMLIEEVESGVHLTKLVPQTLANGQVVHLHQETPALLQAVAKHDLPPEAVKIYLGIKNDFASMLDVMQRMLMESVRRYFSSNPILARIRQLEVEAEFDRFREKPYFPDRGFGPWSVMVHAKADTTINGIAFKKGELIYWRKFENEKAQRRHLAKMQREIPAADFNVSASYVEDLPYMLRGLPANFTQIMVDELKLSPDQVEKLQQLRYDASKEGAFLKLLEKGKKGIGGGSTDLRRVYADYFWRTSNLVSKMFYSDEVNTALSDVHRQAMEVRQAGGNSNTLDKLHERLTEKKEYVFNPQTEWEVFRMWVSLWYLWGVPKSALMNLSSVPVMAYPYLAARFGDTKATAALIAGLKDAGLTIRDPAGARLSPDDHWALEQALLDGTTDQSFAAELAAVTDANALERMVPWSEWTQDSQAADSVRQVMWKGVWFGMLPFRGIEGINRRSTLLAAFRLSREAGRSLKEAYQDAKDAVDYTQNDYSPWNKPRFLEGKQSVALIFFSVVQNMAFFMYGGDRGWWRSLMVLAALGGLFALPGMENFIDVLNWAWRKFSGEDTDLRVEAHRLAKEITGHPELALHGALHAQGYLGWDTSGSVSLGRVIPGTEIIFGQGKFNDRFVQASAEVGGPAGSLVISALQAMADDTSPSALQRWEKMLPAVLRNVYRSTSMWAGDAILDTQGRALVGDVTTSEIAGQAMGFTPVRKTERQEVLGAQRDAAEFYRLRRENLLARLWKAKQAEDQDAENAAEDAIDVYNSKVPDKSLEISRGDIKDSMKSRAKTAKEVEEGIPREKKYRALYEDLETVFRKE